MFDTLPQGLRDATRLTGSGRLLEATAAIQRMLGAQVPAPGSVMPQPGRVPPTIDGTAEWVDSLPADLKALFLRKAKPSATAATGQFLSAAFTSSAGSRPYKLYVPRSYCAGQPVPLIVMLHGCTQSPDDFAAGTGMNEIAGLQNILVVYPGQTTGANMQKCWNWFNEGDQHRDAGEPSLIAGITRQVMADYSVDPQRVYVAGLSAGGAAAAIMGNAYPDLYAAVGVHSGLACGAASNMQSAFVAMRQGLRGDDPHSNGRAVPTIIFHGDRDTTVSPRNGEFVAAQLTGHAAVSSHTEAGRVPGGHSYQRTISSDARGMPVAEQWTVHGAGHAWSGGSPSGSYTDPLGPKASDEMVRFFMEHPRAARDPWL